MLTEAFLETARWPIGTAGLVDVCSGAEGLSGVGPKLADLNLLLMAATGGKLGLQLWVSLEGAFDLLSMAATVDARDLLSMTSTACAFNLLSKAATAGGSGLQLGMSVEDCMDW